MTASSKASPPARAPRAGRAAPLVLAALAIAAPLQTARADVKITVRFSRVNDRGARDEVRVLTIGKDHKVNVTKSNGTAWSSAVHDLGEPAGTATAKGNGYVVRYSVRDGKIVIGSFFHSYRIVTTITTDGHSRCSATREYRLNPGFTEFQETPASRKVPDIHAENVACDIAETP